MKPVFQLCTSSIPPTFAAFIAVHRLLINISTSTWIVQHPSLKDFPEIMLKAGDIFPKGRVLFVQLLPVTWSSPHQCFCFTMKITPFSFNLEINAVSCKSFTSGQAWTKSREYQFNHKLGLTLIWAVRRKSCEMPLGPFPPLFWHFHVVPKDTYFSLSSPDCNPCCAEDG